MDYSQFIKKLELPSGISVPTRLAYDHLIAKAISRADLDDDVRGNNASIELIGQTRGGTWPSEPVTGEYNYVDLVWHECEFRESDSFTYAVYSTDARYLGCCYLYPLGRRRPLTAELLDYDVDVSWWVTSAAHEAGYYATLYAALRHWLDNQFAFWRPYYSNREIPDSPTLDS